MAARLSLPAAAAVGSETPTAACTLSSCPGTPQCAGLGMHVIGGFPGAHVPGTWTSSTSPAHAAHAWVLPVWAAQSACAQAYGERRITPTLIQQNITLGKSPGSCKIFLCLFI